MNRTTNIRNTLLNNKIILQKYYTNDTAYITREYSKIKNIYQLCYQDRDIFLVTKL